MQNPLSQRRYELQAEWISALAHPIRVAIVDLLKDGEVCVCEIADRIGAERSNTSRHLAVMLRSGVLKTRKEGLQVYYSLRTRCVITFLDCVNRAMEETLRERTDALAS